VDVALVSTAEFAMHGGYVGLDFGLGFKGACDFLYLYSQVPPEQIEAVNLHSASSSTALLLRLLFARYWGANPRIIRTLRENLLNLVVGSEASLVFHDYPAPLRDSFPVSTDVIGLWTRVTEYPFVSSVWAVRPGVLRAEHLRRFNDVFHRAVKARDTLVTDYARAKGLPIEPLVSCAAAQIDFYLDAQMLEGLQLFMDVAAETNLLPAARYRSATLTLMGRQPAVPSDERGVRQILEGVLDGARLGIRDGVKLAYSASTGDLALVADTLRKRLADHRLLRPVATIVIPPERSMADTLGRLGDEIANIVKAGAEHVRIVGGAHGTADPAFWEQLFAMIKATSHLVVEALSAADLHWMSMVTGDAIEDIAARLVAAGLDIIGGQGGEMLVERVGVDDITGAGIVTDWFSCMRCIHRAGGASRAVMRVSRHDSWEDRLLHLHKLRGLQDEMPGLHSFNLIAESNARERQDAEVRIRCTALACIFLDNVAASEELNLATTDSTAALLSICAGVRDLQLGSEQTSRANKLAKGLERIGIRLVDGLEQGSSLS